MIFRIVLSTFFIFISPLALSKIDVLYSNGKELQIEGKLKNLRFGGDKYDGESVGKIISFINKNRMSLIESDSEVSKLYFRPNFNDNENEGQARILVNKGTASVKLQQVLYKIEKNGSRVYIPIEGGDVNVYITGLKEMTTHNKPGYFNQGEVIEISTSLVSIGREQLNLINFDENNINNKTFFSEKMKMSLEDKINLIDLLGEYGLDNIINVIYPNQKSFKNDNQAFKFLVEDNSFVGNFLRDNKKHMKRMFLLNNKDEHTLGWRLENPYDLPIYVDLTISKNGKVQILKTHNKTRNVTVNIYRGSTFNLKKSKKRSGLSHIWKDKEADGGFFKQEDYDIALINLSKVVEYFKSAFGWDGYDNRGSDLDATVRFKGSRLLGSSGLRQNAAWAGSPYNQFLFGKGGDTLGDFLNAFDVIGHEYCHAIVAHTAQLEGGNETGALNEHVCDILGVGFEGDLLGNGFDFKIGETVVLESKKGLRDFLNPEQSFSEQPSHMSQVNAKYGASCVASSRNDECGVHYSNGVLNRAIGLSVKELGWAKMKDLVFEVVTKKLNSRSDFFDYKKQMVRTCGQTGKFLDEDCKVIDKNFNLVGLNEAISIEGNSSGELNTDNTFDTQLCSVVMKACNLFEEGEIYEMCKGCGFEY